MFHNWLNNSKTTRVMNAVAAGTSDQNSSSVDMRGYGAVTFIALFGTLSASQVTTIKAQTSSDDGSSDSWTDIEGSQSTAMSDDDDDQIVQLDIYNPPERYIRLVVERATGNAVIDGVIAQQYQAAKAPPTHDADTVQGTEILNDPVEGTA